MKREIALIQPNSPFLINERVFPNIGLVRVATQLQSEGHETVILDYSGKKPQEIEFDIKNIASDYDLYGFSSTTPQFPYTMKIMNTLLNKNPDARTLIGGPHATALYHLRQKGIKDINIDELELFDTIFAGEGEDTLKIFGDGWQKGNLIKDLDSVLIPNRELIDSYSYNYNLFNHSTASIQTQRGCPHQCAFCCGRDVEMYNKVRSHSPKRVIKELDQLNKDYGYSSFMVYDDEVNLNMGRLEELCFELTKRNYKFRGFIRSDNIVKYPESVEWMKKAGFIKLCAGVESGSDRMLKAINKKTTSKMNSEARDIIRKNGIHYEAFMLLGHPDETLDDVNLTYEWLKNNKPDDFDLNVITPYPGSKIYDDAIPSNKFEDYSWEYNGMFFNKPRYSKEDSFYKGIDAQSESNIRTNDLTNMQLKVIRDKIDGELKK